MASSLGERVAGRRLLILGGTAEAVELADSLSAVKGVEIVFSLAGITRNPRRPMGEVRTGGFGGHGGLRLASSADYQGRVCRSPGGTTCCKAQIHELLQCSARISGRPCGRLLKS